MNKVAPKANKKVRDAFNKLGFKIYINSTVKNYTGYFNARDRKITLIASDNTVYHELGPFLAFVVGNTDQTAAFKKIYNAYVTQNASEYFAESFKDYTLNNSKLKSTRPKTYAAIKSALSKLTSAQIAKIQKIYGPLWK